MVRRSRPVVRAAQLGVASTAIVLMLAGCSTPQPAATESTEAPSNEAATPLELCEQFVLAMTELDEARFGSAEEAEAHLSAAKTEFEALRQSATGSDVDHERLRSAADYAVSAADVEAFASEEWASVWGSADATCVNAGVYPTEQNPGG
jgi:hypothetical protein